MAKFSYRTVWQLAGPNIISNILLVSIGFSHLLIVAPLGPDMSAAVVASQRIHFLMMSAFMALAVAVTAVIARNWGAKKLEAVSEGATAALSLTLGLAILMALPAFLFPTEIAALLGVSGPVIELTAELIWALAFVNITFALTLILTTCFRAIGDVIRPLKMSTLLTVLSIILSYAFTRGTLGMPELGISGIPVGTGIGHAAVVLLVLFRFLKGTYVFKPISTAWFNTDRIKQLVHIGSPAMLEQVLIQSSFILFMIYIAEYGTNAFAAYGIGITILSVCIVVGIGLGAASSALSGQLLGAHEPEEAMQSGWAAMRMGIAIMTIMAIAIYLLRVPLSYILSDNPEVREITQYFVMVLAIIQPLMAIEFTIGGALRGGGDTRYPMYVTFAGMFLARVVVGYIALQMGAPLKLMLWIIMIDYIVKTLLLVLRFKSRKWITLDRRHEPLPVQDVTGISRVAVRDYYSDPTTKDE